jgi:uncharacterized protein YwqG
MPADEAKPTEPSSLQPRAYFEGYIYDTFARVIQSWDAATCADIYAISFFIYDNEDDPRQPQVHLSYNTLSEWKKSCKRGTDRREVKWNFAYWPQDFKMVIPIDAWGSLNIANETDGLALRTAWLASEGFEDSDAELCGDHTPAMTLAFVAICVRVARRLHDDGVITGKFGRTIPVIVHEIEYYDDILAETRDANPPGAIDEFEQWYHAMGESPMPSLGISNREEAIEAIRNSAYSAAADALAALLQPSARIFVSEEDGTEKLGGVQLTVSHFGGLPTLPENVAWPTWNKSAHIQEAIAIMDRIFERDQQKTAGSSEDLRKIHQAKIAKKREELLGGESPLAFLGQLSLREIHAVAPLPGWPTEGILAFFLDPAQIKGNSPQSRGHCRILFVPEDVPLRRLDYPQPLSANGRYPERALTARCEWTLEKYVWTKNDHTPLWKDKEYLELLEKLNVDGPEVQGPVHRCGGFAQEFQNQLRAQCQLVTNGITWESPLSIAKHPRSAELDKASMDWQLVMQFDPEDSLGWRWWGSAGRVYFMARRQDIVAGDFSNCWAILQRG